MVVVLIHMILVQGSLWPTPETSSLKGFYKLSTSATLRFAQVLCGKSFKQIHPKWNRNGHESLSLKYHLSTSTGESEYPYWVVLVMLWYHTCGWQPPTLPTWNFTEDRRFSIVTGANSSTLISSFLKIRPYEAQQFLGERLLKGWKT